MYENQEANNVQESSSSQGTFYVSADLSQDQQAPEDLLASIDNRLAKIVNQAKDQVMKLKIIASASIGNVISSLPEEILDMDADEFLHQCSDDLEFDQAYNLDIQIVDVHGLIFPKQTNNR